MTALDWTEFTARRPLLTASAPGRYGTGNPLEKIANTCHVGPLSEADPANAGK